MWVPFRPHHSEGNDRLMLTDTDRRHGLVFLMEPQQSRKWEPVSAHPH